MATLGKGRINETQEALPSGSTQDPSQGCQSHQSVSRCKHGDAFDHLTTQESALHQLHGAFAREATALNIDSGLGDVDESERALVVFVPQVLNLSLAQWT